MGLERYRLNVLWAGIPGMRWSSIVPVVQSMINCFGLPKAVIIHRGGNEIDCMSTVSLCFQLICSLYTINKMCPGSNIVFQIFYLERNGIIPPITGQCKIFLSV